ncbi:MAG: primase-helicase zinc-binding domain-containing protein [Pirellula sp.]
MTVSIRETKAAAHGKWAGILMDAGLPTQCFEPGGHPCPLCGGKDRFGVAKDVNETGAVFCRHCFNKASDIKPGDGIATVAWLMKTTPAEAAQWIADRIGSNPEQLSASVDIITATCRDKRMPIEAFKKFGVNIAKRRCNGSEACRVDLYNEQGVVHSYFDVWPGDKGRVKRGPGNSGLFFPGRTPVSGERWLAVEGVKDAAALVGLGFNAFGYCGNRLASKYARLFEGVDVVIVPDLDKAGILGAEHTAGVLFGIATSVSIARIPGVFKEQHGEDVRDVLRKPDGEKNLIAAIEVAAPWTPKHDVIKSKDKPDVFISMNEATVADVVVRHISNLGWGTPWLNNEDFESVKVFVRGGVLVHAIESDDIDTTGRLSIRELPPCLVRERITQACSLFTTTESDDEVEVKPARPPGWLVDAVHRRGCYGGLIRPLAGIIESPTIRADGSILQTPGYDLQTGIIYRPNASFPPVSESPTKEDAKKAIDELLEVLVDFPMFQDADRSAWLSLVLSMIGRSCISGCVPLFAVTANIRGAGKSLLVDAATLIAYGRRAARQAFTRDDNEMRKSITAVAIGAIPSVLFDNLDVQLGGAALDAAITSATWSDRLLGHSRMTDDLPLRTIWSATGNNISFGSDTGRRVLPIRLQSPLENPEDRSGFAHPDLLAWIESRRPSLAVAALTILKAYFVAGCPPQAGGEWGSFEPWSAIVRGAIVWAGGADPLPTRAAALDGDDTAALLSKLITGIEQADPTGKGLTTKEIQKRTSGTQGEVDENAALAEAVFEICGEKFDARKFGRRIRQFKQRVWEGRFIDDESAGGGVKRWRVRRVASGLRGFSGSKSTGSNEDSDKSQAEQSECVRSGQQPDADQPQINQPYQCNPLLNDPGRNVQGGSSGLGGSGSTPSPLDSCVSQDIESSAYEQSLACTDSDSNKSQQRLQSDEDSEGVLF